MQNKVAIEDLAAYVEAASKLAESVSQDILHGGETSQETVDALGDFVEASNQMEYVTETLNIDKRQLN